MKTVLNIKMDKEVKEQAQELAKYLGIPLSTIVNAHLKAFIRSGEFTASREPMLKADVLTEINKSAKDALAGKDLSPRFANTKDAIAWLHK
jgi:antitoxin component of RelBE/YafQ-DinJ toxin-antitoxin module